MISYVRTAVLLIGFAGVFGLFAARPFMPPDLKPLVLPLATLFFGVPWLVIPIINKLFLGVYLPGTRLTPEQVDAIRQTARKRRPADFLFVIVFLVAPLPIVFLMKEFGWGLISTMAVGLAVSVVLVLLFNFVCLKYGQKRNV